MNKIVKGMIAMGFALGMANSAFSAEALKLGYLVKQPEEPWFQTEWNFADKAGKATREPFVFTLAVIVFFLVLTAVSGSFVRRLERRYPARA